MNLTITGIVVVVIAFLLIRFATSMLYKLFGVLVVVGLIAYAMFYFGLGPFKSNPVSITSLEEKYCGSELQVNKCECIVKKVVGDLRSRWSEEELAEMADKRTTMAYLVKKSFDVKKDEIMLCLVKRGAEGEMEEFRQDLIPIENDVLEELNELKENVTEKTKNLLDSLIQSKEDIDERY